MFTLHTTHASLSFRLALLFRGVYSPPISYVYATPPYAIFIVYSVNHVYIIMYVDARFAGYVLIFYLVAGIITPRKDASPEFSKSYICYLGNLFIRLNQSYIDEIPRAGSSPSSFHKREFSRADIPV